MKKLFIIAIISVALLSFKTIPALRSAGNPLKNDTAQLKHVLDGNVDEWPADRFALDKDTEISYAIDNDATNLHMAIKIPNPRTQIKLMRQGMNVYVDIKGKKKEGTGVEFPVKSTAGSGGGRGGFGGNGGGGKPDLKAFREAMVLKLIVLKTFGFDGQTDDELQGLIKEDAVQIAFNWDEKDVMYIEYEIPLKMVGGVAALNGKKLSIGWKINGPEVQIGNTSTSVGAVAGGRGRGTGFASGGPGGQPNGGQASNNAMEEAMKEQSFWAKYDFKTAH